jgi:tetratricopeptide (TPR) repeat protein
MRRYHRLIRLLQPAPPLWLILRARNAFRVVRGALCALVVAGCLCARADSAETNSTDAAAGRAAAAFETARTRFQSATNDDEARWQFGRACFDWADFATNSAQRADIARQGIDACQSLVLRDPNSAPGHYYMGMDLGQLARTKVLGALRLVSEMEVEFELAASLDPSFDYAGPDRNLGLLYQQTPGWPASVGSRSKAREHLRRAVKLSPNYPENRLSLLEAELEWGDHTGARRDLADLEEIWPAAQQQFAGDHWAASRADWEKRLANARSKVNKSSQPPRRTE